MSYLRCLIKRLSLRQDRRVQTGMTLCWRDEGIDKLTRRRGPALLDEALSAQYVDASAHSERILRSEEARRSHVPVAEFVNLSVPDSGIRTPTTGVWYPLDHDEVIADTKSTIPSSNLRIFKSC